MAYNPILPLPAQPWPLTNVTPFTYRDGMTFEKLLQILLAKMDSVVEELNTANDANYAETITAINALIATVNAALEQQTEDNTAANAALWADVQAAVALILESSVEANDPVVEALIRDSDSLTRIALDKLFAPGSGQLDDVIRALVADADSATRTELDGLYTTSVNGKTGAVVITASDLGATIEPAPNTLPLRAGGGRLPGIGAPTQPTDASNKEYVDNVDDLIRAQLETSLENVLTLDEFFIATRHDCSYAGASAIVEFTGSTIFTVAVAPFDLEITDVSLSFERYNLARHGTNYARGWAQKLRAGVSTRVTNEKSTSTTTGGEAITARKEWSLAAAGFLVPNNKLVKGDLIQVGLGVTGAPAAIQLPFNVTVKCRPL